MRLAAGRALLLAATAACPALPAAGADDLPPGATMSWLDNGTIRLGADLNRGGAIVFLSRSGGPNLVNNYDLGRQIQLSFYGGPVPFKAEGQEPPAHWAHLGWNPVQAGDDHKNAPRLLAHENDGRTLHAACEPLQWPLDKVPAECRFDSWLELDGPVVKARARLASHRSDHTAYPARLQELPAVYATGTHHRVLTYSGPAPFTGAPPAEAPRPAGRHPWAFWLGTEGWAALVDAQDQGLGLITPGRIHFTGGFAGQPGADGTMGNSTGYLASQAEEILDHSIVYEFRYELLAGSVAEIRARAASVRPTGLPAWDFSTTRAGWHLRSATDSGWPIRGHLDVRMEAPDPQLWSPHTFWLAEDAPAIEIEAAFSTPHGEATLHWQRLGEAAPAPSCSQAFPIKADGQFHRTRLHLAGNPAYRGPLVRLRLDPAPSGSPGAWARVKSIALTK